MSALTPHIRVLRAEAEALSDQADPISGQTPAQMTTKMIVLAIACAKFAAANTLEAEEREMEARVAK